MAEFIAAEFGARGAAMELLQLPEVPPLVYGEIRTPGATRTLGVYVHYDGQPPAGPDWVHDPYEPVLYSGMMGAGGEPIAMPSAGETVDPEWRIYARSASDDKAPIPALLAALDALRAAGIEHTSNIKFLFEGEEELGSAHLEEYLEPTPRSSTSTSGSSATGRCTRAAARRSSSGCAVLPAWISRSMGLFAGLHSRALRQLGRRYRARCWPS